MVLHHLQHVLKWPGELKNARCFLSCFFPSLGGHARSLQRTVLHWNGRWFERGINSLSPAFQQHRAAVPRRAQLSLVPDWAQHSRCLTVEIQHLNQVHDLELGWYQPLGRSPLQWDSQQPLDPTNALKEAVPIDFKGNLKKYSEYSAQPSQKNSRLGERNHEGIFAAGFSKETQDSTFIGSDRILTCSLIKPVLHV